MITSFRGEYRFLSNFYPVDIRMRGVVYPSIEHTYQAAKTVFPHEREKFRTCSPGQAKRMGRSITLRHDWHNMKLDVMEGCLRQKFKRPDLKQLLIATGTKELVEGNNWGDTYWGCCAGKGHNHLGKLLMKIRKEL